MKRKLFCLLTLLLTVCSGAWADEPLVTLPSGSRTGYSCNGTTYTVNNDGYTLNGQTVYQLASSGSMTLTVPATTTVSKIVVSGTSSNASNSGAEDITITGANSEKASGQVNKRANDVGTIQFVPTTQTTTYTISNAFSKAVWLLVSVYGTEGGGSDTTPPTLSSSSPANGATGIATSGTIVLTFSEDIESVDASKFTLTGATKGAVAIDGEDATKVNVAYSGASYSSTVTLSVAAEAVADAANNKSAALSDISFTTTAPVAVTGVTLDKSEAEVEVGKTIELTATVAPAEATNKNVTWTSDDEDVATVDANGVVTGVAAGTANITVTTEDGSFTDVCEVTVVEAIPVVSFTIDGKQNFVADPSDTGITINPSKASSSSYHQFGSNDAITITAPFGKRITGITVNYGRYNTKSKFTVNGIDNNSYSVSELKGTWTGSAAQVAIVSTATSGQDRVSSISVSYSEGVSETVTLNSNGYATLSKHFGFTVSGAKAYKAALDELNSKITCTEVAKVPAGAGVLLFGSANAVATLSKVDDATTLEDNDLKGTTAANASLVAKTGTNNFYALSGSSFVPYTASTFAAFKAYFETDIDLGAHEFSIFFEDEGETTSLNEVRGLKSDVRGDFYDLSGRKVAQPTKGLYIVNGRKVVIK